MRKIFCTFHFHQYIDSKTQVTRLSTLPQNSLFLGSDLTALYDINTLIAQNSVVIVLSGRAIGQRFLFSMICDIFIFQSSHNILNSATFEIRETKYCSAFTINFKTNSPVDFWKGICPSNILIVSLSVDPQSVFDCKIIVIGITLVMKCET